MNLKMYASFELWDPWKLVPQITTIILTTLIITMITLIYFFKVKKLDPKDEPLGLVLIVELCVKSVENLVISILGPSFKWLTLYFLYLLSYIIVGNLLSIVGFESQMTSYTTTFAMGLVTFVGIYIFGIKFQRLAFFKRYLNPLELLTQFVPLVSISFRLFGNILGGSIIMALLYQFSDLISRQVPIIGQVNFLAGFLAPFFHFYFDIFFGIIQAVIFSILTLVYWKLEIGDEKPVSKEGAINTREADG